MKRGYMDWDKNLLPLSALEQRRQLLLKEAGKNGILAVVVYGDVYSADELSYYVNYAPYWCNSVAVITKDELYMVTGHNNRVNPWIHTLTGIEQEKLLASGFKVPDRTALSLKERFPEGGKIGLIGKYVMDALAKALIEQGFEPVMMGESARFLEKSDESYRKIAANAYQILKNAFAWGREQYDQGENSRIVTAEIEYEARKNGAMDIVLYLSDKGKAFGLPIVREDRNGKWTVCAVMQYLGVWVSLTETFGADLTETKNQLQLAAKALVPGQIAIAPKEGMETCVFQVLSDSVSDLNSKIEMAANGQVLSVEVWDMNKDIFCSDMYCVTEKGAVAL